MKFNERSYTNAAINAAGRILASDSSTQEELNDSKLLINDWRSAHYYPISTIQMTLRNYAYTMDGSSIVVQRLKKMQTIKDKLSRYPTMRLSAMQDIGGCRAIMANVDLIYALANTLKASRQKHVLSNEKDYIVKPRDSGYRGIHLIYKYVSTRESRKKFNGMLVEIQLRTTLQHVWATAVETAGAFTNLALKSSQGSREWLRFFSLVSSVFAIEEGYPTTPGTHSSYEELVDEIRLLDSEYSFIAQLEAFTATVAQINQPNGKQDNYYVLSLESGTNTQIFQFPKKEIEKASAKYLELEQTEESNNNNVVLVSATSIDNLKKAYPNYFLDTSDFCMALKKHI